jgi:hypothetical protein
MRPISGILLPARRRWPECRRLVSRSSTIPCEFSASATKSRTLSRNTATGSSDVGLPGEEAGGVAEKGPDLDEPGDDRRLPRHPFGKFPVRRLVVLAAEMVGAHSGDIGSRAMAFTGRAPPIAAKQRPGLKGVARWVGLSADPAADGICRQRLMATPNQNVAVPSVLTWAP